MNFFPPLGWVRRYLLRRKLKALRGQRMLRDQGRLSIIAQIKNDISDAQIPGLNPSSSRYIFGEFSYISDLIIRQYLMIRVAGAGLHNSILAAEGGGAPSHVLPPHLLSLVKRYGVPTSGMQSKFVWNIYILTIWAYGVATFTKLFWKNRPRSISSTIQFKESAFFSRLMPGNLPSESDTHHSYDLLSWYANWQDRNPCITSIIHSIEPNKVEHRQGVKIFGNLDELPTLPNFRQWMAYLCWGIYTAVRSFWDLVLGRWWNPFMFAEAAKAKIASCGNPDQLPAEYWFHHTGYIYRPLWTYVAEAKGSNIFLYFYSVNNSAIQEAGTKPISIGAWHLMNWPNYVVWDEKQAEFIGNAALGNCKLYVVGDLPFTDSGIKLPEISHDSVAVFDIQPFRPYLHAMQAQVFEYYNKDTCSKFLTDIQELAEENSIEMVWKRKRDIGKRAHPRYRATANLIEQNKNFVLPIDESVAAHRLIRSSSIIVSMPYTSTALIGRNMGKPSCYYDSSCLLAPDDPAAHGIPIIQGKSALRRWIKDNFTSI